MATLDDKLLGEKLHYYCSSSEDEDEPPKGASTSQGDGGRYNTGPKGVLEDWQRYKQLEAEKREEKEAERLELAKKLSMTCRTDREDREAKEREAKLEKEFEEMLEEEGEFLKDFMKKRMEEMIHANMSMKSKFGAVIDLYDEQNFLDAVDKEGKNVLVMIMVYEEGSPGCDATYGCLINVAKVYDHVKFCRIKATCAGLSDVFKDKGVPAILVYKSGDLISSLVRITDTLGPDFYSEDLQSFLVENGVLHDKSLLPSKIRDTKPEDSD